MEIPFAITAQVPRIHDFDGENWKPFVIANTNKPMLMTTKFAVTCLFATLLRLATNVARNRDSFSTFAHTALNVYEKSQRLVAPLGYTLQGSKK